MFNDCGVFDFAYRTGKFMKRLFAALILSFTFFAGYAQEAERNQAFSFELNDRFPILHPQLLFDSSDMQMATAISEGLFTYDAYSALPVKALAKSFTVNGKTWRFELQENACFENGDPITAEIIKQSWMSLLSPSADFSYASLLDCIQGANEYRTGKNKDKNSVAIYVEGVHTLSVYLTTPTPHLASILCNPAFAAVHPSQLDFAVQYQKSQKTITAKNAFIPISSGAFRVLEYDGKQITFVKNAHYWDAASVELQKMVLRMDIPEGQSAESFNRGEIQWSKSASPGDVPGNCISYAPMFATSFFFFNARDKNVQDAKLRKALLFAIPYENLRQKFQLDAQTFVFPIAGYPEISGINEYNINQAKKLVSELKLTEAQKVLTLKVFDYEYQKSLCEILKEAWESLGFKVNIKTVPAGFDFQTSLSANDYSMTLMTWIVDFADPMAMLELFRGTSTLNSSGWADKHFDSLLSTASNENEISKRYKMLAEAEKYLLDKSMVIPLGFSFSLNIVDTSEIGGWFPNALDIHPFKFLYFKTKELAPGFI